MTLFLAAAWTALWLGILTSISPCPLATNVAAISFIGRRVDRPIQVIQAGLLYTLGRSLAYVGVGSLLVWGLLAVPQVSAFLQVYMNKIMGPVLILVGMILLELITIPMPGGGIEESTAKRLGGLGLWGALPLGILFALSFCPVSAALFFGSLISLCLKNNSVILFPALFGVGTALPVFAFALVLALSANRVGAAMEKIMGFEIWARRITGGIFILVGVFFCLRYIFVWI